MTIKFEHLPEILKGKVKMGKYAQKPFNKKLVEFMSEVAFAFPNFNYTATDTNGWGDSERISKVAVTAGNQPVGSLAVEHAYRSNESTEVYVACSDAMDQKRYPEHRTKHLKLAMKTVKEHFKTKPLDKRASDMRDSIQNRIQRMTRNAQGNASSSVTNAATEVLEFLVSYDAMDPKPATLPKSLHVNLGIGWRDKLNDYRIAQSVAEAFVHKRGACVRIETDGALATLDLATNDFVEHKSTYGLPTNYQEKITMLKLMEECQPIEHVGVWFEVSETDHRIRTEYKYFFLVGGETYTDC